MSKFIINIPCKPYVKKYLELKFGNTNGKTIDISDKALYVELRGKLKKKSYRHEKTYNNLVLKRYSDEIAVNISQDDFYRYGWDLSKTDIVYMNRIFEGRAKLLMRSFVGVYCAMGISLSESINLFQDKYGFTEDVWPKESIYKDCQRNLDIEKNYIIKNISGIIDKITLAKLSEKKDNFAVILKDNEDIKI